jgi:hypothetical protein
VAVVAVPEVVQLILSQRLVVRELLSLNIPTYSQSQLAVV